MNEYKLRTHLLVICMEHVQKIGLCRNLRKTSKLCEPDDYMSAKGEFGAPYTINPQNDEP